MNAAEREAWLLERQTGIGSSDAPAVLRASPYADANPTGVYLSKILPPKAGRMEPHLEWGHRHEPSIAGAIMDHHGWSLTKVGLVRHADISFLLASQDRVNQDGETCEIKTSTRPDDWGEPDTEEVPYHVWVQVQHQLEVAGSHRPADLAWVFVLINGWDFRRYCVRRNPGFIEVALPVYEEFWRCVQTRTPPDVDWSNPGEVESVRRLPATIEPAIDLGPTAAEYADLYESLGAEIAELKKRREETQAKLIGLMGHHRVGLLPGREVRRTTRERKGYTVEPTSYTEFRIKNIKESDRE